MDPENQNQPIQPASSNPFENIKDAAGPDPRSNPFYELVSKYQPSDAPAPTPSGKTHYAAVDEAESARQAALKDYQSKTSFGNTFLNAINPVNWGVGAFKIAKSLVTDPVNTVAAPVSGALSGLTLGGSDALLNHLVANKDKYGISDDLAAKISMFVNPQTKDPDVGGGLKGGFNLGASILPYIATDGTLAAGMKYAAPKFVAQYAKTAGILADAAGFNILGQTQQEIENPNSSVGDRLKRSGFDTAASLLFPGIGAGYKAIRNTIFKTAAETAAPVVGQVAEGAAGAAESGAESVAQKGGVVMDVPASIANPDVKPSEGKTVPVVTNDMGALKNYIKGSNDINYKQVATLGKNSEGEAVFARHEFDAKTGMHTIFTTSAADAASIAHEMGHYLDSKLTDETTKFSSLLSGTAKDPGKLDDMLASYAVKDLGGNATGQQVSEKIASMVDSMTKEIDQLSAERRGGIAAKSASEKFADAVSQVLVKDGSTKAPVLAGFLEHAAESKDAVSLFGRKVAQESKLAFGGQAGEKLVQPGADVAKGPGLSQVEKEQMRFKGQPDKVTLTPDKLDGKPFKGIPPENIVHFNQGQNPRVTAIVSSLDKSILGAAKTSANATTREFVINQIAKQFDKTPEEARAYLFDRAKEIKALARANADKENPVLINTIGKPSSDLVEKAAASTKPPKAAAAVTETVKPIETPSKTGVPDVNQKFDSKGYGDVPKEIEKPVELPRTPTGRQPGTIPFKSENITKNVDAEVFMNTKILPAVEGIYRIAKNNEEIAARSFDSKMTEEGFNKILTERFGNLSEDLLAAKRYMTDSAVSLSETLGGKSIADLSPQAAKDAMSQYQRIVETFEVFSGARTELSNAFRTLGIAVNPGENDTLKPALEAIQKAIGDEKDPFKIAQNVFKAQQQGPVEKYFKLWYSSLLSGPKTQFRIALGSMGGIASQTFASMFTTEGRAEFGARVMGMIRGNKEALDMAKAVFKGEKSIYGDFSNAPIPTLTRTFKGPGAIFDYVGGFMSGNHAYWTTIYKEGEIAALEHGKYTYGLENKDIIGKINEAVGMSTGKLATYANNFDSTFTSKIAKGINDFKKSDNLGVQALARFFTPFVRIVSNLTERKVDFMPLINLGRTFDLTIPEGVPVIGGNKLFNSTKVMGIRADEILDAAGFADAIKQEAVAKGLAPDATKSFVEGETARVRDIITERLKNQQMGRFYTGLAIVGTGIPLAMTGRITGMGPSDANQRALLMQTGWRPESIVLPDGTSIPYQQLAAPFSGVLSVLGNINDAIKYDSVKKDLHIRIEDAFANYMKGEVNQSFLSGIANLWDFASGNISRDKYINSLLVNAIPIPAALTQTKDIIFPERYDATSFNDQVRNKLGMTGDFFGTGWTTPLQPKLDAFGAPVKADLIYGTLPPLLNAPYKNDPVLKFMTDNNIFIGKPALASETIRGRGKSSRPMTSQEYTQFMQSSGQKIYDILNAKVQSGFFDKFPTAAEKKSAMDKIAQQVRTAEKNKIKF